ncbi:hypothetical protein QM480_06470 [Flectobacillus sp. DC10W]|uniref:Uncharacterized protein n=1 Tax=Flectobacillus longus TaxID=2984207 RepID=A0ABT6YK40_9BACT|nr:hypothetical protein [Flectobacillus longus]MDI9863959.1 hypothetical protein [Flectobacillus longus]
MRTSLELGRMLYGILANSDIKQLINGGVYRDTRPINSTKEDIVINSISVDDKTLQAGLSNINLYVPNINVNIDGVEQVMPNLDRLEGLTIILTNILKEVYFEDGNFYITNIAEFDEEESNSKFVNFRIRFNLLNK